MNKKKSLPVVFILLTLWVAAGYAEETIKTETLEPVRYLPAADEENVYYKAPPVIAVDKDNNVYSFFNRNNFIFKMSDKGRFIKNIGRRGEGPGDLFTPKYIRINDNKLFVVDSYALSIFSLDGAFIQKFRIFNNCDYFDLFRDKIVTLEVTRDHLFHIYAYDGKRELSFGKKYKIDFSKFKGFGDMFVDRTVHEGKVICDQDKIYFLSYLFGDVFVYNDKGELIKKDKLAGFDEQLIKKNIEYFFIKGVKIDSKGSTIVKYNVLIDDCAFLGNELYVLNPNKEIFIYDKNNFRLLKKYRFKEIPGKNILASYLLYPMVVDYDIILYIAIEGSEDYYIGVFKIKNKINKEMRK
jgi:outer membrane protein assembly factor BamB